MAVQFLKYKNRKLPVKIGYYSLMMSQEEQLKDGEMTQASTSSMRSYIPMLFYALERGHYEMKKEFTLKREDEQEIIDILEYEDNFFMLSSEIVPKAFPAEWLAKMMGEVGQNLM